MIRYFLLTLILMLAVSLGFWAGRHQASQPSQDTNEAGERKPLYYRHPMNPKITSPTPAKDEMGMDYVAVYPERASPSKSGRILYYRHSMGAADTSPVPKKDEMGMDYLPVYESELADAGQIQLSPEKIQKLGVTTETVAKRTLIRSLHALGSIQVDERRIHAVTPKFAGWIQRLYVNATGQDVKRGQPLLEIYSPELVTAQQEYLIARQGQQALRQGSAQVDFIYPTLATETRTVKVRVELPNGEGLLKPGLYGSVTLAAQAEKDAYLAIPDSAAIDSGTRRIVLLQRSEGRFEPRAVKLGRQADGYREVLEGLEAGDEVVTRANFLIDAESNLKSALDGFGGQGADAAQAMPEAQQGGS